MLQLLPLSLTCILAPVLFTSCGNAEVPAVADTTHYRMAGVDSALVVKNGIRRVRIVTEGPIPSRDEWASPGTPSEVMRKTKWLEFDSIGRVIMETDTDKILGEGNYEISTERRTYSGQQLVETSLRAWTCDSIRKKDKSDSALTRIEITRWKDGLTWKHSEFDDSGQWDIQIDSTVLNQNHQPSVTYTHSNTGDSFVEEFVYDAKARLKYRRLSKNNFWSPPWEMESTSYRYNDDGTRMEKDSVWRIDPDMKEASKRIANEHGSDRGWKLLLAAPSTGTFNRLEWWEERTYDVRDSLILRQMWEEYAYMWEDYSWTYNDAGQILRHTEWRGDRPGSKGNDEVYGESCRDSAWYTYSNGILSGKRDWHYCNTYYDSSNITFVVKGIPIDPNRVEVGKYTGTNPAYAKVRTRYQENDVYEQAWYGSDGLVREVSGSGVRDYEMIESVVTYSWYKN